MSPAYHKRVPHTTSQTYARRRWVVAGVSVVVIGALSASAVGIALALEPTATATSQQATGEVRGHSDAVIQPRLSALSSVSGSLVGGEPQVIAGRGLETIDEIRVGATIVTDLVASDRSVTFVMPRAERFVAGAVPVQALAGGQIVAADSDLNYTYEVRTGVDRQMEYAFRYWSDYNLAEFGTFNPVGGDCVNFVSQTLLARGWEMTSSWHNYNAGAQWTGPWIHVPSFDTWLRNNPQYGAVQLNFDQRDQVKIGDLVVFDWNVNNSLDHIQVVSAIDEVDGRLEIKMVGHNKDTDFRDLDDTVSVDHPGASGYFWSLPAS
jgi:hypothetical protein